jgi:serine/threonine protein phosphatase PrpC
MGDMVSSVPHVTTFNLPRRSDHPDEFIVLACDGLFDVMKAQLIVDFVSKQLDDHGDVDRASEALVDHAIRVLRSSDNVSVVIVSLAQFTQ